MNLSMNVDWLSKTANKSDRPAGLPYRAILWHETDNGSGNAAETLNWNLSPNVGTSYDFLIGLDGMIYAYLDYHAFTSWDSGVGVWTIDGTSYTDFGLNRVTLGVELDGPNDGTPVTPAQIDAAARLAIF